ncbi:MAG TPA: hypothetical protein V6C89_14730 [Drouetiella sp.]|jgi:hypothetical protein
MNTVRSQTYVADLHELPRDLKRVLKVQFREFIHFIEDAQDHIALLPATFNTPDGNTREAA